MPKAVVGPNESQNPSIDTNSFEWGLEDDNSAHVSTPAKASAGHGSLSTLAGQDGDLIAAHSRVHACLEGGLDWVYHRFG